MIRDNKEGLSTNNGVSLEARFPGYRARKAHVLANLRDFIKGPSLEPEVRVEVTTSVEINNTDFSHLDNAQNITSLHPPLIEELETTAESVQVPPSKEVITAHWETDMELNQGSLSLLDVPPLSHLYRDIKLVDLVKLAYFFKYQKNKARPDFPETIRQVLLNLEDKRKYEEVSKQYITYLLGVEASQPKGKNWLVKSEQMPKIKRTVTLDNPNGKFNKLFKSLVQITQLELTGKMKVVFNKKNNSFNIVDIAFDKDAQGNAGLVFNAEDATTEQGELFWHHHHLKLSDYHHAVSGGDIVRAASERAWIDSQTGHPVQHLRVFAVISIIEEGVLAKKNKASIQFYLIDLKEIGQKFQADEGLGQSLGVNAMGDPVIVSVD